MTFKQGDEPVFLSVVVPAYNEAERLPRTLRRLHEFLSASALSYEIIVVLDGPTDNTRKVLQSISGEIARLRVIDRESRERFTVKEGILSGSGEIRLFTDADNSTDIAHVAQILPLFEQGCDLDSVAQYQGRRRREASRCAAVLPFVLEPAWKFFGAPSGLEGNLGHALRFQSVSPRGSKANFRFGGDRWLEIRYRSFGARAGFELPHRNHPGSLGKRFQKPHGPSGLRPSVAEILALRKRMRGGVRKKIDTANV